MPSIAKTLGLILVVVNPACLGGQAVRTDAGPPGPSARPLPGFPLPQGQNGLGAEHVQGATTPGFGVGVLGDGPVQRSGEKTAGIPLSPRSRRSSLPLPAPGRSDRTPRPGGGLPSVPTVVGSLALVLGIFFLVAWGMRRASPAGGTALPNEVFEVLGHAPMTNRGQVHLLRCGNKLILVSVTTAGAETLAEITDPLEVDRLAGLCRQAHPQSATAAFRQVFGQFAAGHSGTGLFGKGNRDALRPPGAGVPATADRLENRDV